MRRTKGEDELNYKIRMKGKSYLAQNSRPWLVPGTVVVVQPGSLVNKPYLCIVCEGNVKWTDGEKQELCTRIPFKHSAVIWEYWADRISPANFIQSFLFKCLCLVEKLIYGKRT